VLSKVSTKAKKPKALVLFSGGLDSTLAMKLTVDQGVDVEAVHFSTPFSTTNEQFVDRFCDRMRIRLCKVFLGEEFLKMVTRPHHGYGSQMNPCRDCRILMLKKANELGKKIGADFLVTGEVLDERPFSQKRDLMLLIEREAGLDGKVLRPLSAKLLPETEPEKKGLVRREDLLGVKGRRRLPQMELAKKLGIKEYLSPSSGCLLTDPRFADRLREHLKHERRLSLKDAELLKVGRHFRIGKDKVIVGRNEEENRRLLSIAEKNGLACMEVIGYMGPLTLIAGRADPETLEKAAAITARYSDSPKTATAKVRCTRKQKERILEVVSIEDEEARRFSV